MDFIDYSEGIIPKSISSIFQYIVQNPSLYTVYCSFIQIYNENLYDLLQDRRVENPLNIREDKIAGIFVEGLTEYVVESAQDCYLLLKRGELSRITRSTYANIASSRSHSIFQLLIETNEVDSKGMLRRAKLNLCDLAGSEKINKDENMGKQHLNELKTINLSLTTLGQVISSLAKGKKSMHVPYRNSKITRLLSDSIGGRTKTCLIATVSPAESCMDETISTMKFADRARQVMVRAQANEINAQDDALVKRLQREVQHLRDILNVKRKGGQSDLVKQLVQLKEENQKLRDGNIENEEINKLKEENQKIKM